MFHILVALVVCALDQLFKYWITVNIELGGYMQFIPGVLGLTYVRNTGAAFSMFSEHTWMLAAISVVASVIILYVIIKKRLPFWEKFCLAMILGGAVGNAIDRIALGYVVDMFAVELFNYAIFNLADAFIDVGAVIFVILYLVRTSREEKRRKGAAQESESLSKSADGNEESGAEKVSEPEEPEEPKENGGEN